jgi:hypothetical protein
MIGDEMGIDIEIRLITALSIGLTERPPLKPLFNLEMRYQWHLFSEFRLPQETGHPYMFISRYCRAMLTRQLEPERTFV